MGDTVVLGSCNGLILGVDKATGRARWSYDARVDGGRPEFHGAPLVAGDLVILSSDDRRPEGVGHTYAIDAGSGRIRWKTRIGRGSMTDIVRLDERIYVVTLDNELVTLDLAAGTQAWSYRGGAPADPHFLNVLTTPAVGPKQIYFGGADGVVHVLATETGALAWRSDVGSRIVTPVVLVGDGLYFGTRDGRLLRLDRSDKTRIAELQLGQTPFGPPTPVGQSLLIFSAEGESLALNAVDVSLGSPIWTRKVQGGWTSSRPYLWRGGVLAGSHGGELSLLRVQDGVPIWTRHVEGVIRGIGDDGDLLFVGTQKGVLLAVKPPILNR